MKMKRNNREKDLRDVKLIEEYLESQHTKQS